MFSVTQLAIEAEKECLQLPHPATDGRYNTLNDRGAMSSKISQSDEVFLKIASQPKAKVLEIGPAYGLVCMEALKRGAGHYVAVEPEIKHLKILAKRVLEQMPETAEALTLILGAFPQESVLRNLTKASFDAILASNVLHFLTEKEVREAFRQFAYLLKPGGKLIATMNTPYVAFLKKEVRHRLEMELKTFLNASDEKKAVMVLPGFVEKSREAIDASEEVMDSIAITRGHGFAFDQAVVEYLLQKDRFFIEKCHYYSLNQMWKLDDKNRDQLMVVARKPKQDCIEQARLIEES